MTDPATPEPTDDSSEGNDRTHARPVLVLGATGGQGVAVSTHCEGAFYAYAYPEPEGFADHPAGPEGAFYSKENGQFLLPYEAVRTAPDPDAALRQFLHATYVAAAEHGN